MNNDKIFKRISVIILGLLTACANDPDSIDQPQQNIQEQKTVSDQETITKIMAIFELRPNRIENKDNKVNSATQLQSLKNYELREITPNLEFECKKKLNNKETLTVRSKYLGRYNGQHLILIHRIEEAPGYMYNVDVIAIASLRNNIVQLSNLIDCGQLINAPKIDSDKIHIKTRYDIIPFASLTGIHTFKKNWFAKYYKINQDWNVCSCTYDLESNKMELNSFEANLDKIPSEDITKVLQKTTSSRSNKIEVNESQITEFKTKFNKEFTDYQLAC